MLKNELRRGILYIIFIRITEMISTDGTKAPAALLNRNDGGT